MGADPKPGLQANVAGSFLSLYSTVFRLSVASTKLLFWTMPAIRKHTVLLFLVYTYLLFLAVSGLHCGTWDLRSVLRPL